MLTPLSRQSITKRWVSSSRNSIRHLAQQATRLGRRITYRVRLRSFDAVARLMEAGIGVGVLPLAALKRYGTAELMPIPLTDDWAHRRLMICARRFAGLSAHARHLAEEIERQSSGFERAATTSWDRLREDRRAQSQHAIFRLGCRSAEVCFAAVFSEADRPLPARQSHYVDSAGEWLVEKHGTKTRRSWRKLHIGVDADTGQIVAAALTAKEVDDGAEVGPLLDQVPGSVASFTADSAYDQDRVSTAVAARHPEAAIIVPPRSTAVPSETAATAHAARPPSAGHRRAWMSSLAESLRLHEAVLGRGGHEPV